MYMCLQAAVMLADPKSAKKLLDLAVFFALLGSAHVKAARKMLVILIPEVEEKRAGKRQDNDKRQKVSPASSLW